MVLQVLESMPDEPMRLPVDPKAKFVPGQVAQVDHDNILCGVSDGTRPIGLIDDIKNDSIDSTDPSGLMSIWPQRMVFRTDQYEMIEGEDVTDFYQTGDLLYVNSYGFLTSIQPHNDAVPVARVISVFDIIQSYERNIIECVWF